MNYTMNLFFFPLKKNPLRVIYLFALKNTILLAQSTLYDSILVMSPRILA